MPRTPVVIPDTHRLPWEPRATSHPFARGHAIKMLTTDPDTGAESKLLHFPPGWLDDGLEWHRSTEESLHLAGAMLIADREYGPGTYFYRPPGIVHGPCLAHPEFGITALIRMDRSFESLHADRASHRDSQPITDDHETWSIPWTERLDSESLPWLKAPDGPWAGAALKWLSRDRLTGGGAVLLDLPPGWTGEGSRCRGSVEDFVLAGSLEAGAERMIRWGYACRSAGEPAGRYRTDEGARLACWLEVDELAA